MNERPAQTVPSHPPVAKRPDDERGGTAIGSIATADAPAGARSPDESVTAGPLAHLDVDEGVTMASDPPSPPGEEGHAERATMLASKPDAAVDSAEGNEARRRRRQRATEEDGDGGDAVVGLSSMVRHLATMTKELSEAQRAVGSLTAERDLLRQQLADRGVTPILLGEGEGTRRAKEARHEAKAARQAERSVGDETVLSGESEGIRPPGEEAHILATPTLTSNGVSIRPAKQARLEARAAREAERFGSDEPVLSPEEYATRAEKAGRRRRRIALGLFAALAAAIWAGQALHVPVGDYLSKGGLPALPYVGVVFQILLVGFLIFRLVRVGGKAGQWLFPSAEPQQKRRRR